MAGPINELIARLADHFARNIAEVRDAQAEILGRSRDLPTRFDMVPPAELGETLLPAPSHGQSGMGGNASDSGYPLSGYEQEEMWELAPAPRAFSSSGAPALNGSASGSALLTTLPAGGHVEDAGSLFSSNSFHSGIGAELASVRFHMPQPQLELALGGWSPKSAQAVAADAASAEADPSTHGAEDDEMPAAETGSGIDTASDVSGGEDTAVHGPVLALTAAGGEGVEDGGPVDLAGAISAVADHSAVALSVTISGVPAGGTFSHGVEITPGQWQFTATELEQLVFSPPADCGGAFSLTVTATASDAEGNLTTVTDTLNLSIEAVADKPSVSLSNAPQSEIMMRVSGDYFDGAPVVQLTVDGENIGQWTVTADHASGQWQEIRVFGDFGSEGPQMVKVGFLKDAWGGDINSDRNLYVEHIEVNGAVYEAEAPEVLYDRRWFDDIPGQERVAWDGSLIFDTSSNGGPRAGLSSGEDMPIALDLQAMLADTDGSEVLAVSLSGFPEGSTLSAGAENGDGSWTLAPAELTGLAFTPAADFNGAFTLRIEVRSIENSNGHSATDVLEVPVSISPANDDPSAIGLESATIASGEEGGAVGRVIVVDPDAGDTHSYSVSDPRFEVVSGELRLKEGVSVDHGSEPVVYLTLKVSDASGASFEEDVVLSVVGEAAPALAPPGQPQDQFALRDVALSIDASRFFPAADPGSSITYHVDGPTWLTIDEATGLISGMPPVVLNELQMAGGLFELCNAAQLKLETAMLSGVSGFDNSLGYYLADESGDPIGGGLLYGNAKDLSAREVDIDLRPFPEAKSLGLFLIPDGAGGASGTAAGDAVSFSETAEGWKAVWGSEGVAVTTYFSDAALNQDGLAVLQDSAAEGAFNWEDFWNGGGDDFDAVNMDAVLKAYGEPVSALHEVTVTAAVDGLDFAPAQFTIAVADERDDALFGTAADDVMAGGAGDDWLFGSDGSDLFLFGPSEGHDQVYGGSGDAWIDIIEVKGVTSAPGTAGQEDDWTVQIENGFVQSEQDNVIVLSQDTDGTIMFPDGSSVSFHDIEKLQWA